MVKHSLCHCGQYISCYYTERVIQLFTMPVFFHWQADFCMSVGLSRKPQSQYRAIDLHNRRGMQQPQQPWYFRVFFFLRLCPSRFTHLACLLNISNENNVYHADLYRGSINLHLTSLNRHQMREKSTDHVRLPSSILQPESCIFVKTGCHVQGKRNLS